MAKESFNYLHLYNRIIIFNPVLKLNLEINPTFCHMWGSHEKRMGLSGHGLCALFGLTFLIGWENHFILGSVACVMLVLSSRIMVFKCRCL